MADALAGNVTPPITIVDPFGPPPLVKTKKDPEVRALAMRNRNTEAFKNYFSNEQVEALFVARPYLLHTTFIDPHIRVGHIFARLNAYNGTDNRFSTLSAKVIAYIAKNSEPKLVTDQDTEICLEALRELKNRTWHLVLNPETICFHVQPKWPQ